MLSCKWWWMVSSKISRKKFCFVLCDCNYKQNWILDRINRKKQGFHQSTRTPLPSTNICNSEWLLMFHLYWSILIWLLDSTKIWWTFSSARACYCGCWQRCKTKPFTWTWTCLILMLLIQPFVLSSLWMERNAWNQRIYLFQTVHYPLVIL